jgi:hypothetical protein
MAAGVEGWKRIAAGEREAVRPVVRREAVRNVGRVIVISC